MPVSIMVLVVSALLLAYSRVHAQSAMPAEAIAGSTGIYAGSLKASETATNFGAWIDVAFKGWALGTIELDVSRSRATTRRGVSCPYDDCTERSRRGPDGKIELISDPTKVVSAGLRAERYRAVSLAGLRTFGKSRHAAPHYLIGAARMSRQISFAYDDPALGGETSNRSGWGPVAGIGVDLFVHRVVMRIQYRLAPIPLGEECFPVCNQQSRVGVGWRF